jgi:Natural resistance-associated macrophage protein
MAKTLGGEAEHEAEKLAEAEPSPEVAKERDAAVQVKSILKIALGIIAAIGLVIVVALLPFGGIERVFGYCGLLMLVFLATAIHQGPDWGEVTHGFVPSLTDSKLYLYFVVGVFAAALMPYEVHFYSSGAVEEGWEESNLRENRLNAIIGYALGGLLACILVVVSGFLFHPVGVDPHRPWHRRAAGPGGIRRDRAAAGARRHPLLRRRRCDRLQLRRLLQPRPVPRLGVGGATEDPRRRRASPPPGCSSSSWRC